MNTYFKIEEMVCPHVYNAFSDQAWSFFDMRLLITLDRIRELINKPIIINTWKDGGQFDERGFRCIKCDLVKTAIAENKIYVSPHMTGQAVDFDVQGLVAEEVRNWLVVNRMKLPYQIRLEQDVNWVHLDTRAFKDERIHFFKP
jgi:hypothetical protein